MRRNLIIIALLISGAIITSCHKESINTTEDTNNSIQTTDSKLGALELVSEKISQLTARNEARRAKLLKKAPGDCVKTAMVPDDYATIQEAVDAVCDYGNVIVKPGIYDEREVFIYKPGLKIKAIGDVTLNGGFWIDNYIDDVVIQKFKIDMTNSYLLGIGGIYNENCNIKQNTVYGSQHIGIYFGYCNNMSIVQNHVSGDMDWGIFIEGKIEGTCRDNTVAQNIVTSISNSGSGIIFRGDCDDNIIQGNKVSASGYGISLWFYPRNNGNCDNNIVKTNTCNDNVYMGIDVGICGSNNTIGPNNRANNNGEYGIILYGETSDNYSFNNTALNNTVCDIVNYGRDNTFKKNNADCTEGVD